MNYFSDKNKRAAIIGTVLFHIAIVLVLVFTGLTPPIPPRPEIGVEVNLGNSDDGMGEKQTKNPSENVSTPPPTPQNITKPENVVTQDQVKTVKVNDQVKTETKTQPKTEPVKEPVIDKSKLFDKNRFKKKGGSEGKTGKAGDQGRPDGSPDAKSYVGSHGTGVSFSLVGRVGKSLPKPPKEYSEAGTVVVSIRVNKSGVVISAVVKEKGTDTPNTQLRKLAIKAAKASLFDAKPDAPEVQVGTIEYVFEIN